MNEKKMNVEPLLETIFIKLRDEIVRAREINSTIKFKLETINLQFEEKGTYNEGESREPVTFVEKLEEAINELRVVNKLSQDNLNQLSILI